GLGGKGLAVLGEELRQDVVAVDADRAHPGQVVETDLVDEHALRLDAQEPGEPPLEADGDVAEPDRSMAGVQESARHDPDRVREVDDPGVVSRELADALGDSEDDRDRPHRLGESARAGRLLPDAAAGKRHRLVREPRLLAADPDLDEDEVGAVHGAVEVVRDDELSLETVPLEHARGETAHDLAALGVDVLQYELAHRKPLALAGEPA